MTSDSIFPLKENLEKTLVIETKYELQLSSLSKVWLHALTSYREWFLGSVSEGFCSPRYLLKLVKQTAPHYCKVRPCICSHHTKVLILLFQTITKPIPNQYQTIIKPLSDHDQTM